MNDTFRHWRIEPESEGVVWLRFDKAGESTNTLSAEAMAELDNALAGFERSPPRGLVIASGKRAGFIAGADIGEFSAIDTPAAARAMVARGWEIFARLARADYPTLALIRGHCMGGGLELALACRYRIAVDDQDTRLALPEVKLGILPAWGGMLRLPQLIGAPAALDLMLSGKAVDGRKARRLGLVDECLPPRVMDRAAHMLVLSGQPVRHPALWLRVLNGPLRRLVAARARKQLAAKANPEHYPAPYAIIEVWENHGGNALAVPAGQPASLESILRSPTARELLRVFFLQERLKGFGKAGEADIERVHVVGAGVMGGDIAAWCALRGLTVTLQDQSVQRIAPAIGRAAKLFARKLGGDQRKLRFALDRLIPDPGGHGLRHADLIIEAISEDLAAKRALFAEIEARARPGALLASNTSSLRIEDIAEGLVDPSRLVGLHFFNPVAMLPLVEVVRSAASSEAALSRAAAFVRAIDKLPLPVRSAPGFLVNAVLGPYMLEALRCVDEGLAPETVDAALTAFGMPIGPIELVDRVGLDIAKAAGQQIAGKSGAAPPRRLAELLAAGHLGRKSGRGFYPWLDGKPQKNAHSAVPHGLADRIIEPLLLAAERCVAEGVVADADLADAGVIFGTGFAPFTGGPLRYLAAQRGHEGQVAVPAQEAK